MAERKQIQITQVQKVIKESSIDCNLNRDALVFDVKRLNMDIPISTSQGTTVKKYTVGDQDYSYVCDYNKCELTCNPNIKQHTLDVSTFDPSFIVDDIDLYKKYISLLYREKDYYNFQDILQELKTRFKLDEGDILSYALQEMLDQKYKISNSTGTFGYIIYRGDFYLFQPFHLSDTRLSLEERDSYSTTKKTLPFDILSSKSKPTTFELETKEISKSVKVSTPLKNVLQHYVELVKNKQNELEPYVNADKIKQEYFMDYVIDRIQPSDLVAIMKEIATRNEFTKDENMFINRLYQTGLFIIDSKSQKPKNFYNAFTEEMYSVKDDGKIVKTGPSEMSTISKEIEAIKTFVSYKASNHVGYIEFKNDEFKFKLRKEGKSGFVCMQSSLLKVANCKDEIDNLMPGVLKETKHVKKLLCDVYELVLRMKGPQSFKRSYQKN